MSAVGFTWGTGRDTTPETNRCPWCGARIYKGSVTCRFCRDLPGLAREATAADELKPSIYGRKYA